MADQTGYRVNAPGVIAESIDRETLIVNLDSGCYYSTRGTGDAAWALLAAGASVSDAAAALRERYKTCEDAIAADVETFLAELVAEELLLPIAASVALVPADAPAELLSWAPPLLEKFTDMQDLLALDPVHEVEDAGWPHALPGHPGAAPRA